MFLHYMQIKQFPIRPNQKEVHILCPVASSKAFPPHSVNRCLFAVNSIGVEPRPLWVLGVRSITELHLFFSLLFETGSGA